MNKAVFAFLPLILCLFVPTAQAQEDAAFTIVTETDIQETAPQPSFENILETLQEADQNDILIDPDFLKGDVKAYDDYSKVTLRFLNKITAESETHDLRIGLTVAYGSLRIRPKACKKSPPIEEPESASFLQVWEKVPNGQDTWVFSGWMFASSPSLSPMEHPVYDIWVIDCTD